MNFLVISLKNHSRRKKFKQTPFVEFHDAVDTRINPLEECKKAGIEVNLDHRWSKHFRRFNGAYGCALSHYSAWNIVSKINKCSYTCILEDDVNIEDLNHFNQNTLEPNTIIANLTKRNPPDDGSASYLVNAEGANLLIKEFNKTIQYPVDKFIFNVVQNKFKNSVSHCPLIDIDILPTTLS